MHKNFTKKMRFLIIFFLILIALYLNNTSLLIESSEEKPLLLAHRGVHQTYNKDGIDDKTCTAKLIYKSQHNYIENTIPSIQAAFRSGADIVELDIHPTTDGHFAVFHDWTLDCRTNSRGVTREHSLKFLKTLDIAYGYTADGGQTFPLRGKGIGLMPSLHEVLTAFSNKHFLINFKSNDVNEAEQLVQFFKKNPQMKLDKIMVYGGEKPTKRFISLMPNVRGFTKKSIKKCLLQYELIGWSGVIPNSCKKTILIIPINYVHWLWGWPTRFMLRMKKSDTLVFIVGVRNVNGSIRGIDTPEQLNHLPKGFSGGIWTNRIEVIGRYIK